jgi:hypothetical protein
MAKGQENNKRNESTAVAEVVADDQRVQRVYTAIKRAIDAQGSAYDAVRAEWGGLTIKEIKVEAKAVRALLVKAGYKGSGVDTLISVVSRFRNSNTELPETWGKALKAAPNLPKMSTGGRKAKDGDNGRGEGGGKDDGKSEGQEAESEAMQAFWASLHRHALKAIDAGFGLVDILDAVQGLYDAEGVKERQAMAEAIEGEAREVPAQPAVAQERNAA